MGRRIDVDCGTVRLKFDVAPKIGKLVQNTQYACVHAGMPSPNSLTIVNA